MRRPGRSKAASRYARAIIDLLGSGGDVRKVATELKTFYGVMANHDELSKVLLTAIFSAERRRDVIKDLVSRMKLSDVTRKVLLVLSDAGRIAELDRIAERLRELILEASNIAPLHVESASTLAAEDKKKVEERFSKLFGKGVEASFEVNPELIGGLRVTAAGRTYDGSIATRLEMLREELVGGI
ncbi:MAG: ATP synthase F1 subunit delta [Deltaproteobacteria bacterium]|nr:ATP synthase F1 subunit delta [Deltaproteobacteria bacterium]